jgi:hypothetical protein
MNKDKFGNQLVPLYPKTSLDTLMACFAIFVYNNESKSNRTKIRLALLDQFERLLKEEKYSHFPPIKSLIMRLHHIDNKKYPKSSYDMDKDLLHKECLHFLDQGRNREGYIFDKVTYCYLFAEMYKIDIIIIHPKEQVQTIHIRETYYTMYLFHDYDKFYLLIPEKQVKKIPFQSPLGKIQYNTMFAQSIYDLRLCQPGECKVIASFAPPVVDGFKVHQCKFYCKKDNNTYVVFPKNNIRFMKPTYVYLEEKLVGYADLDSKTNVYFQVEKKGDYSLYIVVAESMEEARKCIDIEHLK